MTKRKGKYNATSAMVAGQRFDSQAEARRYIELQLLERAGAISGLQVHPRIELQAAFTDRDGKRWPPIIYEADFSYIEGEEKIIEDVKGYETAVFRLKRKLFLKCYPALVLRVIGAGIKAPATEVKHGF